MAIAKNPKVIMNEKQFVERLMVLANRKTYYKNRYPDNLCYVHADGRTSADCVNLVKAVLNGYDVNNNMPGYYQRDLSNTGDCTEAELLCQCTDISDDFSNMGYEQEQLDQKFEEYKETYGDSISKDDVLDAMISDELLSQAMVRDGYVLSEEQKDELLASQKQNIEEQLGMALTDEQFEYVLQTQAGTDVATYREYLAEQYLVQAYVTNMKADMFADERLIPSDADIETFYKKNKSSFISPENVKIDKRTSSRIKNRLWAIISSTRSSSSMPVMSAM